MISTIQVSPAALAPRHSDRWPGKKLVIFGVEKGDQTGDARLITSEFHSWHWRGISLQQSELHSCTSGVVS